MKTDELDTIRSALSRVLGSRDREASIFFVGSTTIQGGSLFIPGLSDMDLLVVPKCDTLNDYEEWCIAVAQINQELNQDGSQLYDIFILSARIASLHFTCLSAIATPLPLNDALIDRRYSSIQLKKPHVNPDVRINIYQAMLEHMISKACNMLPVADTGQARKTAKYLRKLFKVAVCSYANEEVIDKLEERLLNLSTFNSLEKLACKILPSNLKFNDIFQSVMDGQRVNDWPLWMTSQEDMVYQLMLLEKELSQQGVKDSRYYGGIVKTTLMLFMDVKKVLSVNENERQGKIRKFADDTASIIVQLALAGVDSLIDFTTELTPQRVRMSYEVLVRHLEADEATMECFAASIILLEYAFECGISERSK